MINEILIMLEKLFKGEYDPLTFSLDMENYLCDNYQKMLSENSELTNYLNEDVPDICANYEHGTDGLKMINKLKLIYEKAKTMIK